MTTLFTLLNKFPTSTIANANKEAGLNLLNNIDIDSLSSKIEKETKIEKIGKCISDIAKVSKEVAIEIFNRLTPKLREQMPKELDFKIFQ